MACQSPGRHHGDYTESDFLVVTNKITVFTCFLARKILHGGLVSESISFPVESLEAMVVFNALSLSLLGSQKRGSGRVLETGFYN